MKAKHEKIFAIQFGNGNFANPPGQPWYSIMPSATEFPYAVYPAQDDEYLRVVRKIYYDPYAKFVRVVFPDGYEEALRRERAHEPPTFEVKEV